MESAVPLEVNDVETSHPASVPVETATASSPLAQVAQPFSVPASPVNSLLSMDLTSTAISSNGEMRFLPDELTR